MFFENFYEDMGVFDDNIIKDFKEKLLTVDRNNPDLSRPEYCFADGGKLILALHYGQVRNEEFFKFVKPLIDTAYSTGHQCLNDTVPFRIEISIIEPGKSVLWHHDQHQFHKFSERIHFPILTSDKVDFVSKWFKGDTAYKFKMQPGRIYRFNNRSLHCVNNNNTQDFRCHVMIDFINKGVFEYFRKSGKIENLSSNVAVTAADEIYYYINSKPVGVTATGLTDDDIKQLKTLKNGY